MQGRTIVNALNTLWAVATFFVLMFLLLILAWSTDSNWMYWWMNFIMPSLLSSMWPIMYIFCLFGSLYEEDVEISILLACIPIFAPVFYIYTLFMVS